MTDRPTIEQQLAEVIAKTTMSERHWKDPTFRNAALFLANEQATAIIAAVNNGTIDPIVPEGKVVVAAEIGNRSVVAIEEMLRITRETLTAQAELAELRALKAKVDGCRVVGGRWVDSTGNPWTGKTPNDFLAWLRETTDD